MRGRVAEGYQVGWGRKVRQGPPEAWLVSADGVHAASVGWLRGGSSVETG